MTQNHKLAPDLEAVRALSISVEAMRNKEAKETALATAGCGLLQMVVRMLADWGGLGKGRVDGYYEKGLHHERDLKAGELLSRPSSIIKSVITNALKAYMIGTWHDARLWHIARPQSYRNGANIICEPARAGYERGQVGHITGEAARGGRVRGEEEAGRRR